MINTILTPFSIIGFNSYVHTISCPRHLRELLLKTENKLLVEAWVNLGQPVFRAGFTGGIAPIAMDERLTQQSCKSRVKSVTSSPGSSQ